jgi:signal transduction histidine kinase
MALERAGQLIETRRRERDEADRAKDHFLAMLGHELRNPLAPAMTALQLMRRRYPDVATREVEVVERQIEHLTRLVDDLLDVSRLRRQAISLNREMFDLRDAIGRAAEMTAPIFSERRHELDIRMPEPLIVTGDLVRLAQVFANVFTNAAKYTEPGGHVVVSGTVADDSVIVECRDDGIGMDAELIPRVFELFVQGAPDPNRHQGGLGLGLALVRALVVQHGGTIEARSDGPGKGSTFIVRLPSAAAREARAGGVVTSFAEPGVE